MTVEQDSALHKWRSIKTIKGHDELIGKTIVNVCILGAGEVLAISFSDRSVGKLKAGYTYGEDLEVCIDPNVGPYEMYRVGFLTREEYELLEAVEHQKDVEKRELAERQEWERLNKKFGKEYSHPDEVCSFCGEFVAWAARCKCRDRVETSS